MADDMEKDAIEIATFAMNEFMRETEMANHIKKEFDKKYRSVQMAASDAAHVCRTPPPAYTRTHLWWESGFDASSAHVRAARHGTWSSARITARTWSTRPSTLSTFTLGLRPSCSSSRARRETGGERDGARVAGGAAGVIAAGGGRQLLARRPASTPARDSAYALWVTLSRSFPSSSRKAVLYGTDCVPRRRSRPNQVPVVRDWRYVLLYCAAASHLTVSGAPGRRPGAAVCPTASA